jgi:hypothetical protein
MPYSEFQQDIIERIKTHLDETFLQEQDITKWDEVTYRRFLFDIFAEAYKGKCSEDTLDGETIFGTLRETCLRERSPEESLAVRKMLDVWDTWMFALDNYPQPE